VYGERKKRKPLLLHGVEGGGQDRCSKKGHLPYSWEEQKSPANARRALWGGNLRERYMSRRNKRKRDGEILVPSPQCYYFVPAFRRCPSLQRRVRAQIMGTGAITGKKILAFEGNGLYRPNCASRTGNLTSKIKPSKPVPRGVLFRRERKIPSGLLRERKESGALTTTQKQRPKGT